MSSKMTNRKMTLRPRWIIALLILFAMLSAAGITHALAAIVGGYNIDGNVPDAGTFQFSDPYGATDELGPINASTTKLGVINNALPPMLGFTNPNAQVDLRNIWLDTNVLNGQVWLYFAWERDSNTGSGVIMYEFEQAAAPAACDYSKTDQVPPTSPDETTLINTCNPWQNRQPGDFIIVWDQSGKKINIIKRTFSFNDTNPNNGKWDGPIAEPLILDAGVTLTGGNAVAAVSSNGFFGEAAINLSATVFPQTPTSCFSVANIIPGTLTGNSDTADFKDTVFANYTRDIAVSNCGEVKVSKVTDPTGLAGAFPYTLKQADKGAVNYNGDLQLTGTLTKDGDSNSILNLKADADYQLTEGALDPAWKMKSISCQVNNQPPLIDLTNGGTFPVVPSTITYCTITNKLQPGTLIVKKVVVNDNGGTKAAGDFSFQVNNGAAVAFEADGENDLTVSAGSYTVTEPAVTGYTTSYDNCTGVVVANGGSATCTITNNDLKVNPNGTTTMAWVLQDRLTIVGLRTGAPDAGKATASFYLYSDDQCTHLAGSELNIPVAGSSAATGQGIPVSTPGKYYWKVTYSGDNYNEGFTTICGSEVTEVTDH